MSDALRLAEYWEARAKDLQTWVDENDYVEFGYRPEGLKREQADEQRTAAELRRLHAENEALREANEAFGKRQEWWNDKMVALEAINAELRGALRAASNYVDVLGGDSKGYRVALAKVEKSK